MNMRLFQSSLDRAALGVSALSLVLIGLVVYLGHQIGVRVKTETLNPGPLTPITLTFSVPVESGAVEPLVEIKPQTDIRLDWADARTLRLVPSRPLELDTVYELRLDPGMIGKQGEILRDGQTWVFQVRQPLVAYLASPESKSEIWVVGLQGESEKRLFEAETSILDFDASPNGEFIVFSQFNAQNGLDLWMVDRGGFSPGLLLDCGAGRCSTPAISPDSLEIAYTREAPGLSPNDSPGAPRIYIFNLQSGQDSPLFADSQILGYGPAWSPDGMRLSSFDGLQDVIRVVSIESGEQTPLPSAIGAIFTWSPDGDKFAFVDVADTLFGLRTVVNVADFTTGEVSNLIGLKDDLDFGYGALAWSPTQADQLIMGMRPLPDDPAQGLWLMDPEILAGTVIAYQEGVTVQTPRWDLWGKGVIFQQFRLGAAYKPEIGFWKPGFDEPFILAEGLMPRWLP